MMRKLLLTIIIAGVIISSVTASDLGLTINSTQVYSGTLENWAAGGIQLQNGSYIVAWQHATSESSNDGVIYSSISSDFGNTWSSASTLMSDPTYAIFEPQFGIFNNTLFFFYDKTNAASSGNPSTRYVVSSSDGGGTWGSPVTIATGAGYVRGSQNPINLSSERIILPGWEYNSTSGKNDVVVYHSDNNCTSWSRSVIIHPSYSIVEPAIIQFANKTLMALIRNSSSPGGLYQFKSISTDNGSTWSSPAPSGIVSPRAQSAAIKTPTGNFALVWNNVSSALNTPRTPLTFTINSNEFASITNYTSIKSGTGQWSNLGIFTNNSGYIVVPYSDEINWDIYVATMKESDFFPSNPSATMPSGGGGGTYAYGEQFYVITPPSGTQTEYPLMITLTNASCVSGKNGELDNTRPNIVICTNGNTRPDWMDINITDSTGMVPIPFWPENNTQTNTNLSVWMSITTNQTYQVYFGNASQSTPVPNRNIYNTFSYGEDYILNTLNTTQNVLVSSAGGSSSISGGINTIIGGSADREQVRSISQFGTGYAVRSRFKSSNESGAGNSFDAGFGTGGDSNATSIQLSGGTKYFLSKKTGSVTTAARTATFSSYAVGEVQRYGPGTIVNYSVNNVYGSGISTNVPTASINASTAAFPTTVTLSVDWIVVRKAVYPEPSASQFTSLARDLPVTNFTGYPLYGNPPLLVQFNDTSTGSPTSWNWSFGDGNYSTERNATHIYGIPGVYTVVLTSTNTAGSDSETRTNYITITDPTLTAGFTTDPNPSSPGQSVTFTDTSTGTPTTWNWTFGDIGAGNTSTSQNPTHTYITAGNYTVLFNVTNASGSWNLTGQTHTVVNASGYTPQDVWMEGQYNRTFHITSSSDGTPLAATYITSDGQSGTASTLGYAYVTEGFGVYTITVSIEGYATKTVSFIVDEDGTTEIQLTPATTPSQNTNIIYTPHQVRVYTVDAYGVPLIGTNITINYIASTLPTTDTNWLINAYGIESSVAADMVNSSIAMIGTSGDDGSNTFTLFGSLTYGITLTNATVGANCYKKLAPIDASYRIYCPITGQTAVNNTLTAVNTSKLVFYKLNTSSYYNLSMIYEDQTGYTTNLSFNVYDYSAGRTLVYTKNWTDIGTAQVVDNYTVYIPLGKEYQWQYNATKV